MARLGKIALLVLLVLSCPVYAQQWAGTYTTTISEADVSPDQKVAVGNWEVTLGNEGQFTVSQNGNVVATGTYSVSGDQMILTDAEGSMACVNDQASGTYTPSLKDDLLTMTLVDDDCAGRRIVLTSHSLVRKKPE